MRRLLHNFARKQDGTATVESVLWLPVFFVVLFFIVDTSMVFHGRSTILRTIQDANRNMSIGRFTTPAETEAYLVERLSSLGPSVRAHSEVVAGVVTTTVTIPAAELRLSNIGLFETLQITVSADHLIEDWEA